MIPFPEKEYDVIYADPPWRYRFPVSKSRRIENQYNTMSLKDICNLHIPAKENALLYLWATAPKLQEALTVMEAWGFDYRTCAVWDKLVIGMGYWFRSQHELLLVGVKGKFSPPSPSERVSSIFHQKRGKHSVKPEEIQNLISKWYPIQLKIELFARKKSEGWDAWGDELWKGELKNERNTYLR